MSTKRKDFLLQIETDIQKYWKENKTFDCLHDDDKQKYFATFPYPYTNGRLHIGHAFSLSKVEFQCRFQRLLGKNVLFPLGFHCTGMPIAAYANQIQRDLDKTEKSSIWQNMRSHRIPEDEIKFFADSQYWLKYFPPLAKSDLEKLGISVDWRRSFITTDRNKFYDKFIKWQFSKLKENGNLFYDSRFVIFSKIENQPCADHDRLKGEGVKVQKYLNIKLKINFQDDWPQDLKSKNIYLIASTLRPETMYGQTNIFVNPDAKYNFYPAYDQIQKEFINIKSKDVIMSECPNIYVCSEHCAYNLIYQGISPSYQDINVIKPFSFFELLGAELIGLKVKAPFSVYNEVFILPMSKINMKKGTGVVTSVPSESPDDFKMINEIKQNQKLREKYKIDLNMLKEPIDIIKLKNSEKQMEDKKDAYKKAFYEGIMIIGKYMNQNVSDCKKLIETDLIEANSGFIYGEPENEVISRSGDICVAALCYQWFLNYGEKMWKAAVLYHLEHHFVAHTGTMKQLMHVIEWLEPWACSRTIGLGTKLPENEELVIESLSDSTIYMSYYTICHLLHSDLYGDDSYVDIQDINNDVFDYIFLLNDNMPRNTNINPEILNNMRKEFSYWYPLDLRCSGKDLIFNHLMMCLYNHASIWRNQPNLWPREFYCNGHICINNEKMSKSTGNFLTLIDGLESSSADCVRIALADAGDNLDDANYVKETEQNAIIRLWQLKEFYVEIANTTMRSGTLQLKDTMFLNNLYCLINSAYVSYTNMNYRDALKYSLYDFMSARDEYRNLCHQDLMHSDVINKYLEFQVIILEPICPHICHYLHFSILKLTNSIQWIDVKNHIDIILKEKSEFLNFLIEKIRKDFLKSKGKKNLEIFISKEFNEIQILILNFLQGLEFNEAFEVLDKDWLSKLKTEFLFNLNKKQLNEALGFANHKIKVELKSRGLMALQTTTIFDEEEFIKTFEELIKGMFEIESLKISYSKDSTPLKPQIKFF